MDWKVISRRNLLLTLPASAAASRFEANDSRAFRTPSGALPPETSWAFENGVVKSRLDVPRQCDLWTAESFADFDFTFDWKVAPGANSGVKYVVQTWEADRLPRPQGELVHENSIGFEFQLIDDASPDANHGPSSCSGSLYGYLAPTERAARPAGEWNTGRLKIQGGEVEHWLNGRRVLRYRLDLPQLNEAIAQRAGAGSVSARILAKRVRSRAPIALQHHQSEVWFRNLKVEPLEP
jgi:hypothetical protein